MRKFFLILGLLVGVSQAQTTTTITGTIKDLSQALVTSGKVTFTLQPSRDTTISGLARFSPAQVVCLINASGLIKAQDGTSVCTLTMNTALNPPGTYYRVDVWPFNVKTSSFTFYAVLSTYDWSTVVPTPTTSPAQNFVDIFSTQTIGGNKTWSGNAVFGGTATVNNLNGFLYVGSTTYPTWAAAAAACSGANCTIVIPSTYSGVDCPSAAVGLYTIDMRGLGPTNLPCGQNTDTYNGQTATVFSFLRHSQQVNSPLNKSYELTTNVAQYSGTLPASTQSLEGVTSVAVLTGAVTIPNASTALVGLESHGWIQSTGGTLPSLYGFVTGNQLYPGSTTNVTNSYGLRVQALVNGGSGTVTNNYGLILDPQTGGSARNFSFYSGAGLFMSDATSSGINFEDSALVARPVLTALSATNQMRFRPLLDSAGFDFSNAASSTDWLMITSGGVSVPTLALALGNHLNQTGSNKFAGSCSMSAATTCTFTLAAGFSSTPLCFAGIDQASAVPATANAAKCSISGTTVTITAGSSNSLTWDAILIGNPS